MRTSQQRFRQVVGWAAVPVGGALLFWLATTTLTPFHGFVLVPALILAVLAGAACVDARLAPPVERPLDLACGDTRDISAQLPRRRRPAA